MACRCKEPSIAKGKSGSQKLPIFVWKVTMSMWTIVDQRGQLFRRPCLQARSSAGRELTWGGWFPRNEWKPTMLGVFGVWIFFWWWIGFQELHCCLMCVFLASQNPKSTARCPIKRAGHEMWFRIENIEPQRRPPASPTRPWSNPLELRWLWWDLTLTVCHFLLNCGWELCRALMSWKFAVVKIPPRLYGILWIGRTRFGRSCASSTFHPCIHPFAPILWDAQSSPMFPVCNWDSKTSLWRAPVSRKPRSYSHLQLPKL